MKVIIEKEQFLRTLKRVTHEIIENNENLNKVILVGIEKKGTPIAKAIKEFIKDFEGVDVPLEVINISSHRDDHKKDIEAKVVFNNDINGKILILVDDVLYTGRTVRAAMDAIMDLGRPSKIELAVFVDRGHRELPIRADFVGKSIPTSRDEMIVCDFESKEVRLK
ncbi:MAG: bifunctional pyr operon transcriptional regulator/uracil phosphoribosyltransferase PyrR [Acholeplasmatales bacterium]|nr:bifunctional pyr operon transcriptional regulator/uracil phosphoribosyltransferase PyrR [Acholeplasmatales bacterium]MBQ6783117.1 bifunctional pyr operon transcriptional regulator/uracil phosphoribosyltransferase PyrR [Acholeplasmatales bacterium]